MRFSQKAGELYKNMPDERGERADLTSETDFPRFTEKQNIIKETGKTKPTLHKWGTSPKIIDETVRAAREYLQSHPGIAQKYGQIKSSPHGGGGLSIGRIIIKEFLGKNWSQHRIEEALNRLKLYDEGILSREAVYLMVFSSRNLSMSDFKA